MLTSRGLTLLVGAVLAWLVGRTLGIAELYAVSVGAAAVVGLGVLYVRQTTSSMAARRLVERDRIVAGGHVDAAVELRNDARVPSPTLLVDEQVPDSMWALGQAFPGTVRFVLHGLRPGRLATARYRAQATTRGRFQLGPVTIRVRDPFGVAERTRRYTATSDVIVYPRIDLLPQQQVRGTHMGSGSSDTRRVFATGDEFYTMREYVRGDDLRRVHWPSTAHRQTLMVRQMEQPWQAHATVFLDTRTASHSPGPEGSFERAVSAAASAIYHLAEHGYAIRLVTDRDTGRGGPQPWEHAMDLLAVVTPSDNPGVGPSLAATRGGEGLFVAVVGVPPGTGDLGSHPDLRGLHGVRGFGQRVAIVCSPAEGGQRAARTSALLAGMGWQVTTLAPDGRLADAWAEVMQPRARGSRTGPAPGFADRGTSRAGATP